MNNGEQNGDLNRMISMKSPSGLTDQELVFELDGLARREREALPHFLACLSEVERRGLHLDLGHHNLFDYCVGRLKFSEGAAMRRIQSARAAAKHAEIYAYLRDGELNLGVVALLAPHLSSDNASSLLDRARGKSKREIETLVVELAHAKAESKRIPPKMEQCEQNELTFLPGESAPAPPNGGVSVQEIRPRRDAIRLESPGVLKIVFRAGPSFREKLERVRGLLGRRGGRLEEILDAVLEDYLNRRDPSRRKIPARRGPA
ncbi:MAG: hypothetical protein HY403_10655, partial [Elusimicrobia bacterium]|nr:hypothetical protein [Elusimicrobiota bacterium]